MPADKLSIRESNKKPLVSVLIPAFNSNSTIERVLSSVMSQRYRPIEVILIDDGSTPPIPKQLQEYYQEIKLKVIRLNQNLGVVTALNVGLDLCKGDFISRIDADDEMLDGRIEDQLRLITEKNVDLVYSQMLVNGEQNIFRYPTTVAGLNACIAYGNPIPHPAVMIRRAVLQEYRYEDFYGTRGLEDYYLWVRLKRSGVSMLGSESYAVNYRLSNTQISKIVGLQANFHEAIEKIGSLSLPSKVIAERRRRPFVILSILRSLELNDRSVFATYAIGNITRSYRLDIPFREKIIMSTSLVFLFIYQVVTLGRLRVGCRWF